MIRLRLQLFSHSFVTHCSLRLHLFPAVKPNAGLQALLPPELRSILAQPALAAELEAAKLVAKLSDDDVNQKGPADDVHQKEPADDVHQNSSYDSPDCLLRPRPIPRNRPAFSSSSASLVKHSWLLHALFVEAQFCQSSAVTTFAHPVAMHAAMTIRNAWGFIVLRAFCWRGVLW